MCRMTLDEIHAVNLEILKEIHRFCTSRGIRYGLAYGTLLGAIRHRGFIPWDDDADIMMPIDDYNRFVREYTDSASFKLYAPERGNSWLLYGRICEMRRTYFGQVNPWTRESPGIGVDVFPYEPASDDKETHTANLERLQGIRRESFRAREMHMLFKYLGQMSFKKTLKSNCANLVRQIVYMPERLASRKCADEVCDKVVKRYLDEIPLLAPSKSTHCANLRCLVYLKKEWVDSSWVDSFIECGFCGERLMIPRAYDNLLKHYYGDYMVLPPISERVDHSKWQTMLWRNN